MTKDVLFRLEKLGAMNISYVTVPSVVASTSSKLFMTWLSKSSGSLVQATICTPTRASHNMIFWPLFCKQFVLVEHGAYSRYCFLPISPWVTHHGFRERQSAMVNTRDVSVSVCMLSGISERRPFPTTPSARSRGSDGGQSAGRRALKPRLIRSIIA